jgi:hypothetical protein
VYNKNFFSLFSGFSEKVFYIYSYLLLNEKRIMTKVSFITVITSILLLCSFGIAHPTYGQNKKKKNKGKKGELLPSINPEDIQIMGNYKTQFSGLRRQPILGFRPTQQIIPIDSNRTPFMGTNNQQRTNIPLTELEAPAPPPFIALNHGKHTTTFARFGYGNYQSVQARFWGAYPFADSSSYIGLRFNHSSSAGHLDNRPSSFRSLNGQASYGTRINNKLSLNIHAGLQNDFNYPSVFKPSASTDYFRIKNRGEFGGISLSGIDNVASLWKFKAGVRRYNTAFDYQSTSADINEISYRASFKDQWGLASPNQTIAMKIGGRGGNYSPQTLNSQQWGTVYGGVRYKQLFNYQTHLEIAARAYFTSDVNQNTVYPGGELKVDHWFANHLKITGMVQAKPYLNTVEQLHNRNRFLGINNQLIHTYDVNVTGKAEIKYWRGSKLHFGVHYDHYKDYAYFTPSTSSVSNGYPAGPANNVIYNNYYSVNYQNATNFRLFAGITQQLVPERFWLTAKVYAQHPELDGGGKIPFEENWGLQASTTIRPIDRISLKGWANFTGKRHTGIDENTVGSFLLVGARLDLNLIKNIGIYGKLVNILNSHYQFWQGYQERPFQAFGGITIKF